LQRLHTKKNCLHTHLHTHAHIRTHTHTNTHKHAHTHTQMYTHRSPFGGTASICKTASHLRAQFRKGASTYCSCLRAAQQCASSKVVIFMVRGFVFMHPAVHPATHAPGHPSIRAYVHSTIHAVSQGCDNARFNKELAKVGHIPGVSGTSVKEITQTLTGIV